MEIVPIEVFGVHVDVPFPRPLAWKQADLEQFGAQICDPEKGLGLRSEQIRLKRWDDLFGYELHAQLFGENGTLVRTSDRIKFGIRNARTAADWTLIHQSLVRFYTLMDFAPDSLTTLATHVHARFPSKDERDGFLQRFSYSPLVGRPAALGYVQILDWEKDIRVLIEQSNMVPDAVFVAWETQFVNSQDWGAFLATLTSVMDNAANLFDLGFEPMRERV